MGIRESYYNTFGIRPDAAGNAKGVGWRDYQIGDDEFPYGERGPDYGEPAAYSRDSAGHGPSRQNVNVPRGISSDDDRWDSVKEMGVEGWTSGTPPQGNIVDDPGSASKFGLDREDEALGVPFNVAMGNRGTGGFSLGGRVMPATSGEWSAGPSGDQWDKHVDDEELAHAGRTDEHSYGLPFAGDVSRRIVPGDHDPTDDEVQALISFHIPTDDETRDGSMKRFFSNVGGSGFGMTPSTATRYSRFQPGMTWKECVHRGLMEAFVTMTGTPSMAMDQPSPVHDVDLDMSLQEFDGADSSAVETMTGMEAPSDVGSFLMSIDPEILLRSLSLIGKEGLIDTYRVWASSAREMDSDGVSAMTQRIVAAMGKMEE